MDVFFLVDVISVDVFPIVDVFSVDLYSVDLFSEHRIIVSHSSVGEYIHLKVSLTTVLTNVKFRINTEQLNELRILILGRMQKMFAYVL